MAPDLPPGLRIRNAGLADIPGVAVVCRAADRADIGEPDMDEDWLHDDWTRPRFDPSTDAWIVEDDHGQIVAFGYTWDEEPHIRYDSAGYVHPNVRGRGVGSVLVDTVERRALRDRAHVPSGSSIRVLQSFNSDATGSRDPSASGAKALFDARGYMPEREYLHMGIDVPDGFEAGAPPAGITIRPRVDADDRGVVAVMADAFDDPWDYDEAREEFGRARHHDPSLWIVALDGDRHVGALFSYITNGRGQVSALGVRAPWRRSGIGQALLRAAFERLRDRGVFDVRLNVDRDNRATRLYERAGMRLRHRWLVVSKTVGR
jgi:mycothiol synthase